MPGLTKKTVNTFTMRDSAFHFFKSILFSYIYALLGRDHIYNDSIICSSNIFLVYIFVSNRTDADLTKSVTNP